MSNKICNEVGIAWAGITQIFPQIPVGIVLVFIYSTWNCKEIKNAHARLKNQILAKYSGYQPGGKVCLKKIQISDSKFL